MTATLPHWIVSEFIGTGFLVAAVTGSGIMGERLVAGNIAIALLANTIATGAALVALIRARIDQGGCRLVHSRSMSGRNRGNNRGSHDVPAAACFDFSPRPDRCRAEFQ
jgi:hypothetical protein